MLTLYFADAEKDVSMKNLSPKEAIAILSDMKIDIPVPKAAVTQRKRNTALDMAINALNCSEIPNNWIPCSERQPDVNGWYITTISGEICGQDRALSGISEFANGKWVSGDDVDETEMTFAWMPLPEPYQEEEEW